MRRPAIVLTMALLLGACADEVPATAPVTDPVTSSCPSRVHQMDMPYVDGRDQLQRLDLYQPRDAGCAAVPLVVWVHGGGWRAGDKSNGMDPKVELWTNAGWAVASVNYRLTDITLPVADRVVAPSHNEDVAAAVSWLVSRSADLGVDPDRIALLGHSAGAGIAAAVTIDPAYLAAHDLDPSAIACFAPLDTEGFDIGAAVAEGGALAVLYLSAFGTDKSLWEDLSPLAHVGEAPAPDLLLAKRGNATRRAQVDAFADAARAAGSAVTVVDLPTFSHEDVNARIGDPADDQLTPALQEFLTACLEPDGAV